MTGYSGERKSILMVDDNMTNRSMLVSFLEPIGFIIETAGNGDEAIKKAAQEQLANSLQNPDQVMHWELRKIRKDGSMLWVRETARSVQKTSGSLIVLIVCEDITEFKLLEKQLLQSQKMEAVGQLAGSRMILTIYFLLLLVIQIYCSIKLVKIIPSGSILIILSTLLTGPRN